MGVKNDLPLLEDGRTLDVQSVIWCRGYRRDFPWIDLPIFDGNGDPLHEHGIVTGLPEMFFVGLHFLYAMSSATLIGVGRDADRIAKAIASRAINKRSPAEQKPRLVAELCPAELVTASDGNIHIA